jgi:hypothetical protein
VLGQEKKREQLKQRGQVQASFGQPAEAILGPYWSAKKGHFWTAASREEQAKFRPSFLSQEGCLQAVPAPAKGRTAGRIRTGSRTGCTWAVQTRLYRARICWAVQPTAGRVFLLRNVNICWEICKEFQFILLL